MKLLHFLCLTILVAVGGPKAYAAPGDTLVLSETELADRIRGGLLGQILGNLNGLEHEMAYIEEPGEVTGYVPALPEGAWTDDDTDLEWVYITEMQRSGDLMLPSGRIAGLWKDHINRYLWCSNRFARQLMDLGIEPPLTGRLAINPWAEFNISGQFITESFGLIAPAMPQTAARIGLNFAHVTVDAEPAQTTQLFTAMIATAYRTDDLDRILDAGLSSIDPKSVIGPIVRNVREWHARHPDDWRATRALVHDTYTRYGGEMRDKNGYELNTASTIAALLYGEGEFVTTLQTAFNFGWDADNNAATAGTIIGVIKGYDWMEAQGWNIVDRYENVTRDDMPDDETITRFSDRVIDVARKVILEQGGTKMETNNGTVYHIPTEEPSNVRPLPDLKAQRQNLRERMRHRIVDDLSGDTQAQARAAYLAISLDLAESIGTTHPDAWSAAIDALDKYPKVRWVMFNGPPPLGPPLKERTVAQGLVEPRDNEEWWY